jgi:hypothetical protein
LSGVVTGRQDSGLFYVAATDRGSIFFTLLNQPVDATGLVLMRTSTPVPDANMIVAVKAMEATTGRLRWQYTRPLAETRLPRAA